MAKCENCQTEYVGKPRTRYACPKCKTIPDYACHNCQSKIILAKSLECKKCGFFICKQCGACNCNDTVYWQKGIYYKVKQDTQIAYIGIATNGEKYKSYIQLHGFNEKDEPVTDKEYDLEEILARIINRARGLQNSEYISLCPRNVTITVRDEINRFLFKVDRSSDLGDFEEIILGETITAIKEYTKSQYGIRQLKDYMKGRRKELDKTNNATRTHVECCICLGKHRKVKQGTVGNGTGSRYSKDKGERKECDWLGYDKKGKARMCRFKDARFGRIKRLKNNFYPLLEEKGYGG